MPSDAFSLWNIIRDVLDPVPVSEKVHFKGDSEENAVAKPAPESKRVTFKEESEVGKTPVKQKSESEKVPVIKKSENEEAIPSCRQLNKWLATMTANEHIKNRDEKKDQLSPQDKKRFRKNNSSIPF